MVVDAPFIFWCGTISILTISLVCTGLASLAIYNYYRRAKRLPLLMQAFAALLLGDILMWANFLPRDISNIINGTLGGGAWCTASSFLTIACVFAINGLFIYWSIVSWGCGIIASCLYVSYDALGPYKGLYCCIKLSHYSTAAIIPLYFIFMLSIMSMTFWFVRAFQLVRKIEEINRSSLVVLEIPSRNSKGNPKGRSPMRSVSSPSDHSRLSSSHSSQSPFTNIHGVMEDQSRRASIRVMKQGLLLVGNFYLGWTLIALNALLEYFDVRVPVPFDMLAAWLAKISTVINSVLVIMSVAKVSKKTPQPSPVQDESSTTMNRNSGHLYSAMRMLFSLQVEDTPPAGSSEGAIRRSIGTRCKGSSNAVDVVSPIIRSEVAMLKFALRDSKARQIFLTFCVKEFSVENLKFMVSYQQLVDYVEHTDLSDVASAQTCLALIQDVYRMYLATGAPREVNVSHKVKVLIRDTYQSHFKLGINISSINEEKHKALGVFKLAFNEVHMLVLNHSWPRFAKSEYFEKFLRRLQRAERRHQRAMQAAAEEEANHKQERQSITLKDDPADTKASMLKHIIRGVFGGSEHHQTPHEMHLHSVQNRDDCDSQASEPEVSDETVCDEHKHVDKHSVDFSGPSEQSPADSVTVIVVEQSLDDKASEGTTV